MLCVETAGTAGFSSDESDVDEETGTAQFRVKAILARDSKLESMIMRLAEHKKALRKRRGPNPTPRKRPTYARAAGGEKLRSKRSPPVGWPRNFYDADWLKSLSKEYVDNHLRPAEDLAIPTLPPVPGH